MKGYVPHLVRFLQSRAGQRNVVLLFKYLAGFVGMVLAYSIVFHRLMSWEGQEHSWVTGVYWTLVTMSTLGFGDITFESDLGRLFSLLVLGSGMLWLLVLMPFTFIEFFYAPWIRAQSEARAPRELSPQVRGHVILTHVDSVSSALIRKLTQYGHRYVLVVPALPRALELHDEGYQVVVGTPDDPVTFEKLQVRQAALVAATGSDVNNTNVAFTVREIAPEIPIITTADADAAEDILKLAGSSRVFRLHEMMARSLAHRTLGGDARAHIIGRFEELFIAEATTAGTPLVGKTLAESRLRELVEVTVVGVWERGRFQAAQPDTPLGAGTVMVLAGSRPQLDHYNELFCIYQQPAAPVVIVGGGRVGCATGRALLHRDMQFVIVEREPGPVPTNGRVIHGDAATIETLEAAGIAETPAVIITTNSDDTNVYLTILIRRLRSNVQIISRATHERNISTLHRAGADFVMSSASMGANALFNALRRAHVLMLAEGLSVFPFQIPKDLAGKTIAESAIRPSTGCSVVALRTEGGLRINPAPTTLLPEGGEMILIGTVEDEERFLKAHGSAG